MTRKLFWAVHPDFACAAAHQFQRYGSHEFNGFSEEQIIGVVAVDPDACGYLRMDHPELREVVGEERERHQALKDKSSCIEV